MTPEERNNLAKWMAALWKAYTKTVMTEITQEDVDAVITEFRRIWETSSRNELIMDMEVAFLDDIGRRAMENALT